MLDRVAAAANLEQSLDALRSAHRWFFERLTSEQAPVTAGLSQSTYPPLLRPRLDLRPSLRTRDPTAAAPP